MLLKCNDTGRFMLLEDQKEAMCVLLRGGYRDVTNNPIEVHNFIHQTDEPYPEGEPVIATVSGFSYWYAVEVLSDRFPLGEPAIALAREYSYLYALFVLKGRFELGEPIIATCPEYSFAYARDVIGGRFLLGEDVIMNHSNELFKKSYTERFL